MAVKHRDAGPIYAFESGHARPVSPPRMSESHHADVHEHLGPRLVLLL